MFIPVSESWPNGVTESFNDTYNRKFSRRQWFKGYAQLKKQCKNFQTLHNQNHRYSYLKGKTSMEVVAKAQLPILYLGGNTKILIREDISGWQYHFD